MALWGAHLVLDGRRVPPCLRWPANGRSPQHEFIAFAADLLWFTKRHRGHAPAHRGWSGAFKNEPGSAGWHATVLRQYLFVRARFGLAHWCSRGLALTVDQRLDLMTLPTTKMQADRRALRHDLVGKVQAALSADAQAHPDRSGATAAAAVADRRLRLWRTFVLSQRSVSRTARHWALVSGETVTRQAVAKQLEAIERALRRPP